MKTFVKRWIFSRALVFSWIIQTQNWSLKSEIEVLVRSFFLLHFVNVDIKKISNLKFDANMY